MTANFFIRYSVSLKTINIFMILKKNKKLPTQNPTPVKTSFKNDIKIKILLDQKKKKTRKNLLTKAKATKAKPQQYLKGISSEGNRMLEENLNLLKVMVNSRKEKSEDEY